MMVDDGWVIGDDGMMNDGRMIDGWLMVDG